MKLECAHNPYLYIFGKKGIVISIPFKFNNITPLYCKQNGCIVSVLNAIIWRLITIRKKKKMIIPLDSNLRIPPKVISPKQVLVFNAIRYSIDICEISLDRLITNLEKFENDSETKIFDIPSIFLDIWSIINNSVIFKKIICREFNINEKENNLIEINKAKNLRDSNQHIDERLKEKLLTDELPVYGMLCWRSETNEKNVFNATTLYSGTFTSKEKIKMTISNPTGIDKISGNINMLEFRSIVREKKNKKWVYREESVILDQIISDIKKWIIHFDKQLNEELKEYYLGERHQSDLILKTGPIITN